MSVRVTVDSDCFASFMPALVAGYELSDGTSVNNPICEMSERVREWPSWLLEVEHQVGGYGCYGASIIGLFLPLEMNGGQLSNGSGLVKTLRDLVQAELVKVAKPYRPLTFTFGEKYARNQLQLLDDELKKHGPFPPLASGLEAIACFGDSFDFHDFLLGWRFVECRLLRPQEYTASMLYLHDYDLHPDLVRFQTTNRVSPDLLLALRNVACDAGSPEMKPRLYLLWENSD
jgi:hypothetical protein